MKQKIKDFLISGETDFNSLFPEFTNSKIERELKKYFNQIGGNFTIPGKRVENNYFKLNKGIISYKLREDKISLLLNELGKEEPFLPVTIRDYALLHDTHNPKTDIDNGIHFLTREIVMSGEYSFGSVFFKKDFYTKIKDKKRLIIIENKKIFNYPNLKDYFNNFIIDEINDYDLVIYANGNTINDSRITISFLEQFDEILSFFDYDDEGYSVLFKRLSKKDSRIKFVLPKKESVMKTLSDMKKVGNTDGFLKENSEIRGLIDSDYEIQQEAFEVNMESI